MRPNILLVVLDTARADAFEPYGAGDGAGPTVGQLARQGVAFPMAIAPSNWTMPSHASMLTGALPRSIGLAGAPGGHPPNCRPLMEAQRDRLLSEVLRRAGYSTSAVSCNAWISKLTGFDVGFDRFVEAQTERRGKLRGGGLRGRLSWELEGVRARVDDGAREAERTLRGWLGEKRDRPFFWFVNLVECHSPYMPPRPYNDLSIRQRRRVAEEARRNLTMTEFWRQCLGGYSVANDTLARMRHLYGRSIRALDDWLARVLEELDRAQVLDDTLVIVTSDHGENFGEGRLLGHAFSLDQRLTWVPLVISGPDRVHDRRVFSLASLPRVIADAIGLSDHPWWEEPVPPDIGVSQYKGMIDRHDPRAQRTIVDWKLEEEAVNRLTTRATSATDGRWKIVRNGDVVRTYDLQADPFELSAITGDGPAEARSVIRTLVDVVDQAHAEPSAASPPASKQEAPAVSGEELAELEDRLRELGYF